MHIDIAARLRPFSHTPGVCCLVPGTALAVEVFPALLRIYDMKSSERHLLAELPIAIKGPVNNFIVTLDLERGWVRVEGCSQEGFFRYRLMAAETLSCLGLIIDKTPLEALFSTMHPKIALVEKEKEHELYRPPMTDRLSLGNHKAQDWDLVVRRQDLAEVFPAWLRLGQLVTPVAASLIGEGVGCLLDDCKAAIDGNRPEHIIPAFKNLFAAGFDGLLVPLLHDDKYQGLIPFVDLKKVSVSALALLQQSTALIRRLFVDVQEDAVSILPALPPEFHCGRFLHVKIGQKGLLDIEWSKKCIRRMIFHSFIDGEMVFRFKSSVKQFRIRSGQQEFGSLMNGSASLQVVKNQSYCFDQFQH